MIPKGAIPMKISGLQKLTLLDYPGRVACTVFLNGCNFRCPFCHNSELLSGNEPPLMTDEEFFTFLKKRKGLLDAVCVSGGGPTLQRDLESLLRGIRELGFLIKLDTNGSRPEVLKKLVTEKLVDYVAMDIKNSPQRYGETAGVPGMPLQKIEETMQYLLTGDLDYEFRTTVVEQFHNDEAIAAIGSWLSRLSPEKKARRLFLQPYADRDSVLAPGLSTPSTEKLTVWAAILAPYADFVGIRGTD
jgi:pyruvate formate lyase activating enzyme